MSIRDRIDDSIVLAYFGRHEGALMSALVAVAATAEKKYDGAKSNWKPGKKMSDAEKFQTLLKDEAASIYCGHYLELTTPCPNLIIPPRP